MPTPLADLLNKAKQTPRRIILPETDDARIRKAATQLVQMGYAKPISLTPHPELDGVEIFQDRDTHSEWLERVETYFRDTRNFNREQTQAALENRLFLSCALIALGYVDGGIAGSVATTADVLRAGLKVIPLEPGCETVSSFFLMALSDQRLVAFADCAVVPEPSDEQLSDITIATADNYAKLTGQIPKIALLSFSTLGSGQHDSLDYIHQALDRIRTTRPDLDIDGELQFDTAFNPDIAARKAPNSSVAGQANVFIFPNLNAANIGYKIAQEIGGAQAIGPFIQGFSKPWMDLSRGCRVEDIVNLGALTSVLVQ